MLIEFAEDNKAEEERKSRTAEFELGAKNIGIAGEACCSEGGNLGRDVGCETER